MNDNVRLLNGAAVTPEYIAHHLSQNIGLYKHIFILGYDHDHVPRISFSSDIGTLKMAGFDFSRIAADIVSGRIPLDVTEPPRKP